MQKGAVLVCPCIAPMGRRCLTPTSNRPFDVDYTRYLQYVVHSETIKRKNAGTVRGAAGTLQGLLPSIRQNGTLECHLLPGL